MLRRMTNLFPDALNTDLVARATSHYTPNYRQTPLFLVRGVQPRLPGQIMREKHLRLQLVQGGVMHGARWFHAPLDQMPPAPWDIALRIQRNFWRGEERWQFTIEDARPSVAD